MRVAEYRCGLGSNLVIYSLKTTQTVQGGQKTALKEDQKEAEFIFLYWVKIKMQLHLVILGGSNLLTF